MLSEEVRVQERLPCDLPDSKPCNMRLYAQHPALKVYETVPEAEEREARSLASSLGFDLEKPIADAQIAGYVRYRNEMTAHFGLTSEQYPEPSDARLWSMWERNTDRSERSRHRLYI